MAYRDGRRTAGHGGRAVRRARPACQAVQLLLPLRCALGMHARACRLVVSCRRPLALPAGSYECCKSCLMARSWAQAVVWGERAIRVADAAGNCLLGATARHQLGAVLIIHSSMSGASVRVGQLRALLREADELTERCKRWAVSGAGGSGRGGGARRLRPRVCS